MATAAPAVFTVRLDLWLIFLATEVVLILTPGPAVLLIVSEALQRGAGRALWSNAGILAANAAYFVVSATSLGAVLVASYDLFFAIKWLGAAYLVFLGIKAIRGRAALVRSETALTPARPSQSFANAFLTQASNPKVLVFFASILPQFVEPTRPLGRQMVILGATSLVAEFGILAGYGLLADRAARLATNPRFARLTSILAGVALLAAGVGLAFLKRT